jgi:hypothetical protein
MTPAPLTCLTFKTPLDTYMTDPLTEARTPSLTLPMLPIDDRWRRPPCPPTLTASGSDVSTRPVDRQPSTVKGRPHPVTWLGALLFSRRLDPSVGEPMGEPTGEPRGEPGGDAARPAAEPALALGPFPELSALRRSSALRQQQATAQLDYASGGMSGTRRTGGPYASSGLKDPTAAALPLRSRTKDPRRLPGGENSLSPVEGFWGGGRQGRSAGDRS